MKMELRYKISGRIVSLIALGVVMLCTSIIMFICDPKNAIVKKLLQLSPGSIYFNLWSVIPYEIFLKVYVFNITNPDEFLRGEEKMKLVEVGPFVYREFLTHINSSFNDEDGTLTYRPVREFMPELSLSVSDAKSTYFSTTNIPLVGIQAFLNEGSFITNLGFSTLARSLGAKPILNITVDEYLWGYDDKLVQVANRFIPSWIDFGRFGILERMMNRDNNNVGRLALDPSKYDSPNKHFLTEEEQLSQYHLVEWNGSPGLKEWGYIDENEDGPKVKKCSLIEGKFDGTIFPRDLRPNRTLHLFRKAFCRPVPIEFVRDGFTEDGYRAYTYKLADWMFDTPETVPENECYCYKNQCVKGLQSIAPCYYGIPVVLSQPHFLNADPSVLEQTEGLSPEVDKHGSMCHIQPDLGVPLGGNMRVQINLGVGQTKYNSQTRPFNGLNVPLFWLEITTGELPSLVKMLLTLVVTVLPIALELTKYLLGIIGLGLISCSVGMILFYNRSNIPRTISLKSDYTPIPIVKIPGHIQQYYMQSEKACS